MLLRKFFETNAFRAFDVVLTNHLGYRQVPNQTSGYLTYVNYYGDKFVFKKSNRLDPEYVDTQLTRIGITPKLFISLYSRAGKDKE
jgi:hypothetical protein